MRILISPQGFKGTLSGQSAANAIAEGARRVFPDSYLDLVPIADGGHGSLEVLAHPLGASIRKSKVIGPYGKLVFANWGVSQDKKTAVLEMAEASGLVHAKKKHLDPWTATTFGTGQLIRKALDLGCNKILIGLGGSATMDAGAGALQALKAMLTGKEGNQISYGPRGLLDLEHIDISQLPESVLQTEILLITDVNNPLCGENGASAIYGPQKGALEKDISLFDKALNNFAQVLEKDLGIQVNGIPGMGAAGGLAAGMSVIGAKITWGAKMICDLLKIDDHIRKADLVITGEGRIDKQTLFNKAPLEIAARSVALKTPCLGIGGSIENGIEEFNQYGFFELESTIKNTDPIPNFEDSYQKLVDASERICYKVLNGGYLIIK